MFSKALKVIGLIGGGILALGTGSLGSHLAQPHLEPLLNPERKNREEKLQESFKDAEDQVEALTRNLNELNQSGELQKTSITNLEGEVEKLDDQLKTKSLELTNKEQQLSQTTAELQRQKDLNVQQSSKITNLTSELDEKTKALTNETTEKEKVKGELEAIDKRLKLTSQDILTKKAQDKSSLKVNVRQITWTGFSDGAASFSVVNYQNITKPIKVKKNRFPNYEKKAREIQRKGITFKLHESFKDWEKTIYIERYDVDYGYAAKSGNSKNDFIVTQNTTKHNFKIGDYFKEEYLEEAFKVLIAIVFLDVLPICHDLPFDGNSKPYVFCEEAEVKQKFVTDDTQTWKEFTGKDEEARKFRAFLYSFATLEDFISYWTQKTVEFVRTGTVDLLDFLNPIVFEKYYKSS